MAQNLHVVKSSFSGGEASPSLYAQVTLAKYASMAKTLKNFFVHPHGGASNRSGFYYVAAGKYNDKEITLLPFEYSILQNYMLEFGDYYTRFYANGGQVQSGGAPYEVVTPYSDVEIAYINYTQSADVLYLAHPRFRPRTLSRLGATNWLMELYDFVGGPFMLQNTETGKTLMASAVTGAGITLTAVGFTFEEVAGASHIGSLWQLSHNIEGQAVNLAAAGVSAGIKCGGTWRLISHGTWTGAFKIEKSIDGGVTWTNLRSFTGAADFNANTYGVEDMSDNALPFLVRINITAGTPNVDLTTDPFVQKGIAKITAIATGGATATATVTREIGFAAVATIDWAEGAWSDYRGWPSNVEFHPQDRLIWASTKTQPQTSWTTKTGNYVDFSRGDPLVDSDGITVNLPSRKVNAINGLVPLAELLALTSSGEWGIGTVDQVLSPTSITQKVYGYEGSYGIRPVVIGNRAIYVQAMGQVIRDLGFELLTSSFTGGDLSILSNHLFDGYTIRDMTYQQNPSRLVWCVRSDGKLLSMTYMREQEVLAWTWHDTNESGALEWTTGTLYVVGNWVTHLGIIYQCNVVHTSGIFADDIIKWTVTDINSEFKSCTSIPRETYDELWAVVKRSLAIPTAAYGANFLIGGTPSASSENGINTAEKAVDGYMDGVAGHYWQRNAAAGLPQWWKYDLGTGRSRRASQLRIWPYIDVTGYPAWVEKAPKAGGTETAIRSLAVYNGKLYGGSASNGSLWEWNGVDAWVQVAPQLGGETAIHSLTVFNSKLYGSCSSLLEWNGVDAWVEVAPVFDGQSVLCLTVFNNKLYGGTSGGGYLFEWNGVDAWVSKAIAFNDFGANTDIYSLAVFNNKIYGATAQSWSLIEWNGVDAWVQVAPALGGQTVRSLAVYNSKLYGGTSSNGKLYEWNGVNAWTLVAPQLGAETAIYSLAIYNGKLYGGTSSNGKLYEWNDTNAWVEKAPQLGAEAIIYSLAVFNNKLYGGTSSNAKLYEWGFVYTANMVDFILQGSNDNANWTDVYAGVMPGGLPGWQTFIITNSNSYRFYRIYITSEAGGGGSGSGIEEIEMMEFVYSNTSTRSIERQVPRLASKEPEDQIYMDSAITYDGVPAQIIGGLNHLEGKTVAILADGNVLPQQVVCGNQITLDALYSKVHVGIPYEADLETLNIEVPLKDGTLQGRKVKVSQVTFRLLKSRGGWIGPDFDTLHEISNTFRTLYGTAATLLSDDVPENLGGGYADGGRICLRQKDPLPITVLAILPIVSVGGTTAI